MVIPNSSPQSRVPLERDNCGNPRFHGCLSIREFDFLGKLGEGTFGEVYKARSKKSGAIVALKKILMHNEKDGFPITALREIKLLKMLSHPNILRLQEMAVERPRGEGRKKPSMYMVTPYMEHDLSGLLENPSVHFTEPQIKCYMLQLLEGLRYLHENKILHRDMKAANLLINNKGILQIADFGLARPYDEPPPQPGKGGGEAMRDYTTLVVTRWYRPPELLLQLRKYTTAIDMWGVGCVFGEMFKGKPILAGSSDINQAHLIFSLVGSPTEENMPGWSSLPGCDGVKSFGNKHGTLATVFKEQGPGVISLLNELLKLDWRKRINAIDALQHPFFRNPPLPARPGEIPVFEDSHELDRRKFRGQKAALPPAPAGGSVGMGPNGEWSSGSGSRQASDQKSSRIPGAARGPPANGVPGASRRPFDSRINDVAQGHRRQVSDEPRGHLQAWQRDSTLPPKPPVASHQPWAGGQGWRGDSRPESRRDGHPPRREGGLDSYVPDYNGHSDRGRGRDDGRRDPVEMRDYDRDRSRRRSRSQEFRDRTRSRETNPYYDHRQ
ncbi:CMGC/CDK protein kinase [Paracoccidioides brasiliensis Pb18]|uniref:Serine/threonine-protein kinase BUR1 n=2 Tax=Paracoccidioides brasiliensis TaxID=121759 RepID=C1GF59_PARBD|nr:CMGC/CDK protein kinase [Paracoccidioides brasiliensis Pb18]EEH49816.1 CMGC/CDK protein kinase [Paracoccidioides brasiliensis Pb18]ODH25725.1 CMGC/CDK protein kinase [Paracoccidioides brasiliensis]ODH51735.1 CMGC/CDK protein kinase [Paracoccidioides brasiliensis]